MDYVRNYTLQPAEPKLGKQVIIDHARKYLKERNVTFAERNHGTVFLLEGPNGKISFWPTTSKWANHAEGGSGEGIASLVEHYNKLWDKRYGIPETNLKGTNVQVLEDRHDDEVPW